MKTNTPLKILSYLPLLFLALSLLCAGDAEARRHRHHKHRWKRAANGNCASYSWMPKAKSVPGGRQANSRVPHMTKAIQGYLAALNAKGCGLMVNSTFRSCFINRKVGGMQKSRHLCGSAADTTGCSKPIARSVCSSKGFHYIEEGRGKFPHCQVEALCNSLSHD